MTKTLLLVADFRPGGSNMSYASVMSNVPQSSEVDTSKIPLRSAKKTLLVGFFDPQALERANDEPNARRNVPYIKFA